MPFNTKRNSILSREMQNPVTEDFFFIGIDFGTTCTGVAWAYSRRPDDIHVIQSWPSGSAFKVPSTIRYHIDGQKSWGFEAPPEDPASLQWFKLLLVDDKDMNPEIRSCSYITKAKVTIQKANKQPQEVVKDYLSAIWLHTIDNLCKHQRRSVVDLLPFRVVLTVPATWTKNPKATETLNQAAKRAGILDDRPCGNTELHIVAEPEAAAFSTLMDSRGEEDLVSGDAFVMCDAGGGTVDLITYEMEDTERMQVKECVEGDGGACGSIFVDQEMEKCMQKWLGRRWTSLDESKRTQFKGKWATNKCNFDGTEQQPLTAEIGKGSKRDLLAFRRAKGDLQVDKGLVKFERGNMTTIFSPVTKRIIELVGKQIHKATSNEGRSPKVLILVGGLGGNRYLYNQLKIAYPNLDIIQRDGDKPITAICRGAVYKAISLSFGLGSPTDAGERLPIPGVTSRVASLSYGVSFFETFDATVHDARDRTYYEPSRKDIADNLMHWYLKRGENIADIDRPSYTFRQSIRSPLPGNRFVVQIWKCDLPDPPNSRRGRDDVVRFIEVSCSLDTPFHQLPRCENPLFREVLFQLDLVPNGPKLEFVAQMNGQVRGRKDLNLNFV